MLLIIKRTDNIVIIHSLMSKQKFGYYNFYKDGARIICLEIAQEEPNGSQSWNLESISL